MYHGPRGLSLLADRVHRLTQILALGLTEMGYRVLTKRYFDTLTLHVPHLARHLAARAREESINLRVIDADHLGISLDETVSRRTLRRLLGVFARKDATPGDIDALDARVEASMPDALLRTDPILTHPVFEAYHSETEMMRDRKSVV